MFNTTRSTRPLAPVRIKWQCVIPLVACLLCAASGGSAHVPGPVWRVGGAGAGSERAGVGGVGAQLAQSYDSDIGELMRTRVCGCRALEEREDAAASSRVATVEGDGQGIVLRGGSGESELLGADGRIEMIIGPMFAGKSTELMRRIRRHKLASRKCIVIKYALDVRHGEAIDELATHDNNRIPARPCSRLADVLDEMKDADVVGIDEAQFYPDLVDVCEELANLGKVVILSALDGTFQKEPFGPVLTLLPRAESITKLSAVCKICCKEASFTRRTTSDTALEAIGGAEMYMPTCRRCFTVPLQAAS